MAASLSYSLTDQGISTAAAIHANLGTAPLIEHALANGEGILAKDGPFVVDTGQHTGRSAKDKFIVRDAETENTVWWGNTNASMTPAHFAALKADFLAALHRMLDQRRGAEVGMDRGGSGNALIGQRIGKRSGQDNLRVSPERRCRSARASAYECAEVIPGA